MSFLGGVVLVSFLFHIQMRVCSISLEKLKQYEIVTPRRAVSKGQSNLKYIIRTVNDEFHLDVQQRNNLLNDHVEISLSHENERRRYTPRELTSFAKCQYHGRLQNGSGKVVLNNCNGLRGTINLGKNETYMIEPINNSSTYEHILYKSTDVVSDETVDKVSQSLEGAPESEKTHFKFHDRERRSTGEENEIKIIKVAIVVDHEFYVRRSRSTENVVDFVLDMINYANMIFDVVNVKIALSNLEIWTNSNQTMDSIHQFATYNRDVLLGEYQWHHDTAQLLTGITSGSTSGLALGGPICIWRAQGLVRAWHTHPHFVAGTLAHEIGHNLGLSHYGSSCSCSSSNCLMAQYASTAHLIDAITECTKAALEDRCGSGKCHCMLENKNTIQLYNRNICGNGFTEEREECDCGPADQCKNTCCDANTCKLTSSAQCAEGKCCDINTCSFKTAGSVCREARDSCDLNEICSGTNSQCPEDIFVENFSLCNKNTSYCHDGSCIPSHQDQCKRLWGENANFGNQECYVTKSHYNERGSEFGNCGKNPDGTFKKCAKNDAICGKLICYGNDLPKFVKAGVHRKTVIIQGASESCRSAALSMIGRDPTLALHGTKCGTNMVCHNEKCVNETGITKTSCHKSCENQGVCTNTGKCYCKPGTGGQHCSFIAPKNLHGGLEKNDKVLKCANGLVDGFVSKGCRVHISNIKAFTLIANYRLAIDWKDMFNTVVRMTCDCAKEAKHRGFAYFGIQFWGECWASNTSEVLVGSTECKNISYKTCSDKDDYLCVGDSKSIYLYSSKTSDL